MKKGLFEIKSAKTILKEISENFQQAEKYNNERATEWKENYEYYLAIEGGEVQEETGAERCSTNIPKIGEKVDWHNAKMIQAIYNYRPIVNIVSKETDNILGADLLDELVDYQIFKVPNARRKIEDQIKDADIIGNGVIKTFWDNKLYQPSFDSVPRADIYIDPYARFIDEARFVIHKFYRTQRQLEQSGLYDMKALKDFFAYTKGVTNETGQWVEQLSIEDKMVEATKEGRFEIWEYWTTEGLVTVGLNYTKRSEKVYEGMYILRKAKKPFKDSKGNGYLPFVMHTFDPKPHEMDGLNVVSQLKDLADEYNTKHRQLIDATNFAINKQALVRDTAFKPYTISQMEQNVPGAMFRLRDNTPFSQAYQEIKKGDVPNSIFQELGLLDVDMQKRVGMTEATQGQPPLKEGTATAYVGMLRRSDLLFSSQFEDYANDTLIPLTQRFIWANQQFHTKEIRSSKIKASEGKTFTYNPKEIQHDFDLELNVSAIRGSDEMQRAQLMQIIQLVGSMETIQAMYPNIVIKLVKKLCSTMDMIKNAEELFQREEGEEISQGVPGMPAPPGMQGAPPGNMPGGFGPPRPTRPTTGIPGMPMAGNLLKK